MKRCSRCKETKAFEMFHKNRSTDDGYNFICKPCKKIAARQSYERNKEEVLARLSAYYRENQERIKAYAREYCSNNRHKYRASATARQSQRRALKLQTAKYGNSELNELVFQEAYEVSEARTKCTGVRHHVDHIVPLQGKDVCGFHVWNNLRVVPYYENLSKGNNLMEDLL